MYVLFWFTLFLIRENNITFQPKLVQIKCGAGPETKVNPQSHKVLSFFQRRRNWASGVHWWHLQVIRNLHLVSSERETQGCNLACCHSRHWPSILHSAWMGVQPPPFSYAGLPITEPKAALINKGLAGRESIFGIREYFPSKLQGLGSLNSFFGLKCCDEALFQAVGPMRF